jgi:hypothetical protein
MTDPPRPYKHGVHARRLPRRIFMRRLVGLGGVAALGGAAYGVDDVAFPSQPHRRAKAIPKRRSEAEAQRPDGSRLTALADGVTVPQASWVLAENARAGTTDWVVTGYQTDRAIEGFADAVSATAGDEVTLFVNTVARSFHVEAYRMGYYQGLGGRLVWRTDEVAGSQQPSPEFLTSTRTVQCRWSPSLSFKVKSEWPPGAYLLKLVGDGGQQQYVPLCVRDDTSTAAFVIQHSVTTWQAYNLWGGYDLYYGLKNGGSSYSMSTAGMDFGSRSRVVSFDRPYPKEWAQGAADFMGNEFPLLFHMEELGLDVTYWTDVDLHVHPERLLEHRCLMSLGHDEYWSLQMRDGASQARDAGVNLAFLGANACYRQIRFGPSPLGDNRQQVCYKSASEDPLFGENDAVVTAPSWDSPPTSWPESQLIGSMYQDVGADADLVVADASSWIWGGTGVTDGQRLHRVVQGEYDRFDPSSSGPQNVEIAAHSPVTNRGSGRFSDVTWYTTPGGGGVFATGNASWVNKLSHTTAFPTNVVPAALPGVTDVLLRAMENVYSVLGTAPGSATRPSRPNWQPISSAGATPAPTVTA